MVHLTVLLLLCVGCLVSMLIFNTVMHHRLQSFAVVQDRHRTISDVCLIIDRNVSRLEVGFQHMLLAESPEDLKNAEVSIRASLDTVGRAAFWIRAGSSWKISGSMPTASTRSAASSAWTRRCPA